MKTNNNGTTAAQVSNNNRENLNATNVASNNKNNVESLDECTTAYHHATAASVAHICRTIAEAVGICYASTFPASDMELSLDDFAKWQTATEPDDTMNPAAPFFFAVRKQGSESGTREHCKERCSILGAPVYVIKVEREEAAGLFTLKVRVSSPATREHITRAAELADTVGSEAAPRLAQFEDLKQKHPAAVLIFSDDRAAYYTCYNEDADRAAGVLGLTINAAEGFRFVSFPAACLTAYLARLVRCGIRCAVCEQTEQKKAERITEKSEDAKPARNLAATIADSTARTLAAIKPKAAALTSAAALLLVRVLFMAAGLASGLAVIFAVAVVVPEITPDGFASALLLRLPALFAAVGLWAIAYNWAVYRAMPDSLRRYIMDGHR